MKRVLWFAAFLFAINVGSIAQTDDLLKDSKPASTNIPNGQFPQITSDLRVIYKIKAPDAQKVQLTWGKNMTW